VRAAALPATLRPLRPSAGGVRVPPLAAPPAPVARCADPLRLPCLLTEFLKTAAATLVGFGIMGFIGFFVKLIHIPINNIIVG
jgi:hypothetical protein